MALQIKISGATPKGGKPLCHSCKYAAIVSGQNCEELIFCDASGLFSQTKGLVTFKVSECSKYHPSNIPWLHEMQDMAWKIEARKRGPSGFKAPAGEDIMEVVITKPRNSDLVPSSD